MDQPTSITTKIFCHPTGAVQYVHGRTVNLSAYPDLVVIYLGMRVNMLTGLRTLIGFGPKISKAVDEQPPGLLLHESIIYSLFPPHVGMRQYWRDFESLERWSRSEPHQAWWRGFLRDSGGTGFWHEAYFMRGGMEAVYIDMPVHIGFGKFVPQMQARGSMFSARQRAGRGPTPSMPAPLPEGELYQDSPGAEGSQLRSLRDSPSSNDSQNRQSH